MDPAAIPSSPRVVLVAPAPPPYGGMALQARLLKELLCEDGCPAVVFASNFPLPGLLRPLGRIPGLRTALRTIMIFFRLWRQVRQSEVVHVFAASWWYFFLVVSPAVLVGRTCRKRVVLNYRGGEAERFFKMFGWAARPAFRLAAVVTAPSEFLASVIRQRFQIPVPTVSNVLDTRRFEFRERLQVRPRMLVTRHLEKMYDVESVLKAFRLVQERYPEASLWIAGTGGQAEYLRRLVCAWGLRNTRFLGHVRHEELPSIYDQCDILLNASRVDNFPAALLEASAAGLVVVSTRAGGIPFIYQNGKNAVLVDLGDWRGLALGVEQVLHSQSFAADLARAALDLVRQCDWQEVRNDLYGAYGFPLPKKKDTVRVPPEPAWTHAESFKNSGVNS